VSTQLSWRTAFGGPQIRPDALPEGSIGGFPPMPAIAVAVSSRCHRPKGSPVGPSCTRSCSGVKQPLAASELGLILRVSTANFEDSDVAP
jgi:hypothetical protein